MLLHPTPEWRCGVATTFFRGTPDWSHSILLGDGNRFPGLSPVEVDLVVACLGPLALRLAYPDERKAAELVAALAGAKKPDEKKADDKPELADALPDGEPLHVESGPVVR